METVPYSKTTSPLCAPRWARMTSAPISTEAARWTVRTFSWSRVYSAIGVRTRRESRHPRAKPVYRSASSRNPCSERAAFHVRGASSRVAIRILDMSGRTVRRVTDTPRSKPAGELQQFNWDGLDDYGHPVPSGIYAIQVSGPSVRTQGSIIVLRYPRTNHQACRETAKTLADSLCAVPERRVRIRRRRLRACEAARMA